MRVTGTALRDPHPRKKPKGVGVEEDIRRDFESRFQKAPGVFFNFKIPQLETGPCPIGVESASIRLSSLRLNLRAQRKGLKENVVDSANCMADIVDLVSRG